MFNTTILAVHKNVKCDECGMSLIRGNRYNCTLCINYDICSICNSSNIHNSKHPMIQYKQPISGTYRSGVAEPVYSTRSEEDINSLPASNDKICVPDYGGYSIKDDYTIIHGILKVCIKYEWDPTNFAEFISTFNGNSFKTTWSDNDLLVSGEFKNIYEALNIYGNKIGKPYINQLW